MSIFYTLTKENFEWAFRANIDAALANFAKVVGVDTYVLAQLLDANGYRVTNVGEPQDDGDAARESDRLFFEGGNMSFFALNAASPHRSALTLDDGLLRTRIGVNNASSKFLRTFDWDSTIVGGTWPTEFVREVTKTATARAANSGSEQVHRIEDPGYYIGDRTLIFQAIVPDEVREVYPAFSFAPTPYQDEADVECSNQIYDQSVVSLAYTGSETGARTATINVERVGPDIIGDCEVTVETSSDDLTDGVDYVGFTETLSWDIDELDTKTLELEILSDEVGDVTVEITSESKTVLGTASVSVPAGAVPTGDPEVFFNATTVSLYEGLLAPDSYGDADPNQTSIINFQADSPVSITYLNSLLATAAATRTEGDLVPGSTAVTFSSACPSVLDFYSDWAVASSRTLEEEFQARQAELNSLFGPPSAGNVWGFAASYLLDNGTQEALAVSEDGFFYIAPSLAVEYERTAIESYLGITTS